MITWIRSKDGDWHWYSVYGCGAGWVLNDWSGRAEMQDTEGPPPEGVACVKCLGRLEQKQQERTGLQAHETEEV